MPDRPQRGRMIVIAIIAWYFLTGLSILVVGLGARGALPAIALGSLLLELVLFYFLYTGHNWARLLTGILSLLIALFEGWISLNIRDLNLAGILVFLCLGGSFLLAAGLLFFSPDVRAYFAQRST